jgi:carboxymethylenebutenolidase
MPEISIPATDNSGAFSGYLARPNKAVAPGLLLIQEIFGVNANMRALADGFASQGYLTLVPDLFWRQQPGIQLTDQTEAEWQKAFQLYQGFDLNKGIEDLTASLNWLRQAPDCSGKVGAVGYCLGGRLAVLMMTRTDCDAAVSYYGVALDSHLAELPRIKKPLLMHVAEKDKYATPEMRAQYEPLFKANPVVEYHLYEGQDHAFARVGGEHYDKATADLANTRTRTFLQHHLNEK